jgi:hypothetical protein
VRTPLTLFAAAAATSVIALLSACAAGGSQVAPIANQGLTGESRFSVPGMVMERGSTVSGSRLGLRIVDPATVKSQIYVGQYGATSDPGEVNDYNANNSKDKKEFVGLRHFPVFGPLFLRILRCSSVTKLRLRSLFAPRLRTKFGAESGKGPSPTNS